MSKRKFSFRVKVPWYRWRLPVALWFPLLFFGYLAIHPLISQRPESWTSRLIATALLSIPFDLCLWWAWRERYPFRHEATQKEIDDAERTQK